MNDNDREEINDSASLQRQLETIQAVNEGELPLWLFGGFAEDAWLYGEPTREHNDLDYFGYRDDMETIYESFGELGFDHVETEEVAEGCPAKYVFRDGPVAVDVAFMDKHPEGDNYIEVRNSDGTAYRVEIPDEMLEYSPQKLGETEVRTTHPALGVLARRFFQYTNRLPWRDKDTTYQRKILENFPEADVQPEFTQIEAQQ
jgi:hypothetical protein